MKLTDEQREELNLALAMRLHGSGVMVSEETLKALLSSEQALIKENEKIRKQLEAKLIFINNGQNEEQWLMQEQLNQAIGQLEIIKERSEMALDDGDNYAMTIGLSEVLRMSENYLASLSQEKDKRIKWKHKCPKVQFDGKSLCIVTGDECPMCGASQEGEQ